MSRITDTHIPGSILLILFLFFFSVYLLTSSGHNPSLDAELRYQLTKSIVEKGTLTVPDDIGIPGVDSRFYSFYGLGQSLLAIPLFIISKPITWLLNTPPDYAGEFMFCILNTLLVSLMCVLLFKLLIDMRYSYMVSLLTTFVFGLSTPVWFYAKYPSDNVTIAFFILLSFFLAYRRKFFLSSLCLGFAIITREYAVLFVPFILIFLIHLRSENWKRHVFGFVLGIIPFLAVVCFYNYYRYGNAFQNASMPFPYGVGAVTWSDGTSPWTNFIPYGLYGFFLSPGKGIIFYSPIILLSIIGFFYLMKDNKLIFSVSMTVITLYIIVLSAHRAWAGGMFGFGPRFLIPIFIFFMIPLASYLKKFFYSKGKLIFLLLFSLGIAVQIGGISVNPQRYVYKISLLTEKKKDVDVINSFRYFPIAGQFINLKETLNNIKRKDDFNIKRGYYTNYKELLRYQATINLPWFWWIFTYYVNMPRVVTFIVIILLLSLAIFSLVKLLRYQDRIGVD